MLKLLIAGLALAVLVLLLVRCPSRNAADTSGLETTEPAPAEGKELPRMAADTDWSAFDEAELNGLIAQLEEARVETNRRNEFSVIVADGETIVTDGYETGPGTFAFTCFTPEIVSGESGDLIQVSTRRIEVNVSGDEGEFLLPAMTFRPGQRAGVTSSFISESGEETEGWSIDITADLVPGGISIKGSTGY